MAYTREKIVEQAKKWIGKKESDGSHEEIIDIYNNNKPLARGYAVKYTDHWCATTISALAIVCKYTSIIPLECSCNKMIALFQKMGRWEEDDSYVPEPGDIVFYDWQDSGVGDCKGDSEHVGLVECVKNGKITVIEGNYSDAVKRRTLDVNGRYIRGYGLPKYDKDPEKVIENGMTTGADPQTVWNYLLKKLNNEYAVAGVMGNLYAESNMIPCNLQNSCAKRLGMTDEEYTQKVDNGTYEKFVTDSCGYGLAQWTYHTRKKKLLEYAQKKSASIGNLEMQLEYLWQELSTSYSGLVADLKKATSAQDAASAFLTKFEKPADQSQKVHTIRGQYASKYYFLYTKGKSVSVGTEDAVTKGVKKFQEWLNREHGSALSVDGKYGPKTRTAAIKALQKIVGVKVDGIAGNQTLSKAPVLKVGSKGSNVLIAQGLLYCHGVDAGGLDYTFGIKMEVGVRNYQSYCCITDNGKVDKATWAKLVK